jgi:hypothetical protein
MAEYFIIWRKDKDGSTHQVATCRTSKEALAFRGLSSAENPESFFTITRGFHHA